MDPRLVTYYNRELQYMREMGGEFAREFPKVAGRLGLDGFECADPYVERLLENLDWIYWSPSTLTAQRNWIGRSEGALLRFLLAGDGD